MATPALEALHFVLTREGLLDDAGKVLFLRAQPDEWVVNLSPNLRCVQPWKPMAVALEGAGLRTERLLLPTSGLHDSAWLLPNRQRESMLADVAAAHEALRPGGWLLVSLHQDWGARGLERQLQTLGVPMQCFSKHHCRVALLRKQEQAPWDATVLQQWSRAGAMQRMMQGRFWSVPGLFCWDAVDRGSALLAEHLPTTLRGDVADLGAGWGFLSDHLLRHCPDIDSLDCHEADAHALECLRRNLGLVMTPLRPRTIWSDVTAGVGRGRYDVVVSNPPFHEGRDADPTIGLRFIGAAAAALRAGGHLWLVANRQLPYEAALEQCFTRSRCVAQNDGFKVLHAEAPRLVQSSRGGKRGR